jgi:DNA-binding beta-propeller fold protein YncE
MTKMGLAIALAVFVLAAQTGCGGSGDETAAPEVKTESRASLVEVARKPEVTTLLAEIQEASLELPGGPDWMTVHDGFVWVKRDDGVVTRIDPQTNKPSGEVRADTKSDRLCQGIGSGGGAVWSCSGSDIVRIDPKRLKVVASIPVSKTFDQGRLVYVGGMIWVISGEGDRLVGIDPSSDSVGPTIELPVPCRELGPGVDTVWVLCPTADTVLAVDPVSASVQDQIPLATPSVAFGTESDLWVGYEEGLARIDVESLEQVARFADLDPGITGTVAVDGDDVWVRSVAGFLYRIDAKSNTVAEQIEPESPLGGGDVLIDAESVWVSAYDDNVVLRLRR